jgi:RecA/RadA recombinase
MKKEQKKKEFRFSTGCDLLDMVVGGDKDVFGFRAGKVINIVGDKSSGKSFLAAELIANALKQKYGNKFKWVYDDCESGFTFDTSSLYGFDVIPDDCVKSETVEELYCHFREFLEGIKNDEVGIYVIDSLDGLSSDELLNRSDKRFNAYKKGKTLDKGSYQMGAAKFMSQEFFRGLAGIMQEKNVLLIIISQVRDNIDPFSFKKLKRGGGKALDHYCDIVLWLANVAKIKKKDRVVEIVVRAKTEKSKTPRPFRTCDFSIIFDYGLDNIGSNLDYLFDLRGDSGALLKSSQSIVWNGESVNMKSLTDFIKDTGNEEDYKKIHKTFKKSDILEYINGLEELKKKYQKKFGKPKTRNELILEIEESEKLQQELTRRVVEKWEKIEDEIKTTRLPKYKG